MTHRSIRQGVRFAILVLLAVNEANAAAKVKHKPALAHGATGSESHRKNVAAVPKSRAAVKTGRNLRRASRQTTRKISRPTIRQSTPQISRQSSPSNDRYREIQDALAKKGYLNTPSTGQWDQNSQEAMRRFQSDQNLGSSGKLTAKSITALGLGSSTAAPVPPPVNSQP